MKKLFRTILILTLAMLLVACEKAQGEKNTVTSTPEPTSAATVAPTTKPTDIPTETPTETPTPAAEDVFSYTIENNQVTITGLKDESVTSIVIPSTIENYPVTAIGERAFYCRYNITYLSIPDSVTSVGKEAFWRCFYVKEYKVPEFVSAYTYSEDIPNGTRTYDFLGRTIKSEYTGYGDDGNKTSEIVYEFIPEKQTNGEGDSSGEYLKKITETYFKPNSAGVHKLVIENDYDAPSKKRSYYDSNDKLIRQIVTEPDKCTCYDSEGNKLLEYGVTQFVKFEDGSMKEYFGDVCVRSYTINYKPEYPYSINIYEGEEAVKNNTVTNTIEYEYNVGAKSGAWSVTVPQIDYHRVEYAEYDKNVSMTLHRCYEGTEGAYIVYNCALLFSFDMYYSFEE